MLIHKTKTRKTPDKRDSKKLVEMVAKRVEMSLSSSGFDVKFDAYYDIPPTRSHNTKGDDISKGLEITSFLTTIMQKTDKVEEKVDRVEERLGQL